MEKDKSTISEELDHIRNSINQKNVTKSDDDNFIIPLLLLPFPALSLEIK